MDFIKKFKVFIFILVEDRFRGLYFSFLSLFLVSMNKRGG